MRKTCFTCFMVGLALVALYYVGAGAATATTPTLTHLWNFDGNLNDSGTVGGKTADALGTGTTFGTPTGGGISGQAAQFDGINDLLYVQGMDAIPEGPFTLSFWEYCTNPTNQGYFVSDAAVHPEYMWENLMLRRRTNYQSPGPTSSIKPFAETGAKSTYYTGYWQANGYWEADWPEYATTIYASPPMFPDLPTGEWVHHVITYNQPDNTSGWGEWYVNGQVAFYDGGPDPFTGLMPLEEDPDPELPFVNRREGFVIGNLIDNSGIPLDDTWGPGDHIRVGPQGNYQGYIDQFQVYDEWVTPDQVRYLKNNPGADLRTYTAPAASTQPKGAHVYRWKFDGNLNEEGGSGYNGTAVGNATVGTNNGVIGGAVYFDGDNDAVTMSPDVLPAGAFSAVFWSKEIYTVWNQTPGTMLSEETSYGNFWMHTSYQPQGDPPKNTRILGGCQGTAWTKSFGADGTSQSVSWSSNVWYQHVYTVNADGDALWYVNNQLMTESPAFPFAGLLGDLWLGNTSDYTFDFKGYLDDLQIYNWDLNATDVAWLWANAGQALTITGGGDVYQPYDVNEDGFIGADDLDVVRAHWGESGPGGKAIGDINLDEFVGADDLDQLRAHWGEVCPPIPGLVPEPSTFVLLMMGALALIAVRRVR